MSDIDGLVKRKGTPDGHHPRTFCSELTGQAGKITISSHRGPMRKNTRGELDPIAVAPNFRTTYFPPFQAVPESGSKREICKIGLWKRNSWKGGEEDKAPKWLNLQESACSQNGESEKGISFVKGRRGEKQVKG